MRLVSKLHDNRTFCCYGKDTLGFAFIVSFLFFNLNNLGVLNFNIYPFTRQSEDSSDHF